MSTRWDRATSRDPELLLPFTGGAGGVGCGAVLLGLLTVVCGWMAFMALNQLLIFVGLALVPWLEDPSASWPSVTFMFVLFSLGSWVLGWLTAHLVVRSWRIARGRWWLRLSSTGFELNSRLGRPHRYEWREIDKFMLVAQSQHIDRAILMSAKPFAQAYRDGDSGYLALVVGFHMTPEHPRTYWHNRIRRIYCDREGTRSDGLILGYWDRPFDEAVDLLNEWLTRYKTA